MKRKFLILGSLLFLLSSPKSGAQQQDVPEPAFVNFSIQPPYVPSYHGRDPFLPLGNLNRASQISIVELDYHGVILMGGTPMALFTWRGNPTVRYTLKGGRLYSGGDKAVAGVVGNIANTDVVLVQGDQKIVYPRK